MRRVLQLFAVLLLVIQLTSCAQWIKFDLMRLGIGFILFLIVCIILIVGYFLKGGNKNK